MTHIYIPKFSYQPLQRRNTDEGRRYETPDGLKLPSVTTILDATKPEEKKKALLEWRRSVGEQRATAITTEAANRGTRMHAFLEEYVKTGELPRSGSNPFSIQSHTMANSIIQQGLCKVDEYWGVEVPLYFPQVYAGTTDCCGVHQKQEAILDFKQTNKPKKREWIDDYFIQLAAYAEAHNEVHGTKIRRGVILMADVNAVYQEFILEGSEFEHFRSEWWRRVEQFYSM